MRGHGAGMSNDVFEDESRKLNFTLILLETIPQFSFPYENIHTLDIQTWWKGVLGRTASSLLQGILRVK